ILNEFYDVVKPDTVIHFGDGEFPYGSEDISKYLRVEGNTDSDGTYSKEGMFEDASMYYTHGQLYGIKQDRQQLTQKADEVGAKYALYGHSLVAKVERLNGVYCINPGIISSSRNEYPESYLVIDTDNNLASYYSRKHQLMD